MIYRRARADLQYRYEENILKIATISSFKPVFLKLFDRRHGTPNNNIFLCETLGKIIFEKRRYTKHVGRDNRQLNYKLKYQIQQNCMLQLTICHYVGIIKI